MLDERNSFVPYLLVAIYECFYFFIIDWLRRDIYTQMDKSGHFSEGDKANKGLQFYPRYLMFLRSLQEEQINSQRVSNCLDLCKSEIELENTKGKATKYIGKLIIGFIISGVFLLAKTLESTKDIVNFLGISLLFVMLPLLIATAYRSKEEKLRELYMFMQLYRSRNNKS
jgi:hypothetical protein